jgi:hypothetical protein
MLAKQHALDISKHVVTDLVLSVGRVSEDSTVQESAVNIANHGTNVAGRVLLLGLSLAGLQGGDVILYYAGESGKSPTSKVTHINENTVTQGQGVRFNKDVWAVEKNLHA